MALRPGTPMQRDHVTQLFKSRAPASDHYGHRQREATNSLPRL
jgi:hypothetical protein